MECSTEIYLRRKKAIKFLEDLGIKLEPSSAHTQSQKGAAERSGGLIKVNAMQNSMTFPEDPMAWDQQGSDVPHE